MLFKKYLIYFSLLILLIFILLTWNLGKTPFWIDESITVVPTKNFDGSLLSPPFDSDSNRFSWQIQNNIYHPEMPLHLHLLVAFFQIFGVSEFSARLPSVIFGILFLCITFLMCKNLYNEKMALLTTIFFGTSVFFLIYSQQAIYIILASLMFYLTFYQLLKIFQTSNIKNYIFYFMFLFFSIITHPMGFIIIPISLTILLLNQKFSFSKENFYKIFIGLLIFIALYLPIFAFSWKALPFFNNVSCSTMIHACHKGIFFYPKIILHSLSSNFFEEQITQSMVFYPSWIIFFVGLFILLKRLIKKKKDSIFFSSIFFVSFFILSFFEIKNGRYLFFFISIPLSVCLAYGTVAISQISKKFSKFILIFLIILIVFSPINSDGLSTRKLWVYKNVVLPPEDNFEYMKIQSDFINENAYENDIVISTFDNIGLQYYTERKVYGFLNSTHSSDFFIQLLKNNDRVWIVNTLSSADYCRTRDQESMSCMEKYYEFIQYYRKNCDFLVRYDNVSKSTDITCEVYLCQQK